MGKDTKTRKGIYRNDTHAAKVSLKLCCIFVLCLLFLACTLYAYFWVVDHSFRFRSLFHFFPYISTEDGFRMIGLWPVAVLFRMIPLSVAEQFHIVYASMNRFTLEDS